MSNFTNGPWRYEADGFMGDYDIRCGANVLMAGGVTSEDDARLIAAAPDLLEALEAMLLSNEEIFKRTGCTVFSKEVKDRAISVVRRARGAEGAEEC